MKEMEPVTGMSFTEDVPMGVLIYFYCHSGLDIRDNIVHVFANAFKLKNHESSPVETLFLYRTGELCI